MAGIQIGGIMSGLDTNALVEQMTKQANVSVDRLKGQLSYKEVEFGVYSSVNDMMTDMSGSLLSLKLESTYLTKKVNSTNSAVATATATTDASIGSHSIKVNKLAKNSEAVSSYTKVGIVTAGANVTKITGNATESLEGKHTVTVSVTGASKYLSTDVFEVQNVGSVKKQAGSTFSNVDANGNLTADVSGQLTFAYTDSDGNAQSVTINGTFGTTGQDINTVSTNIQDTLNTALNSAMGTNNVQYAAFRADFNSTGSTWNFSMYETTIANHNITFSGTDAGTLRNEIGFSESTSPSVSTSTKINKYHLANTASDLQNKLASSTAGLIPGATITQSATITTGTFVFAQDASLKVSAATYSTYVSDTVTAGTLNLTAVGLNNAGFSVAANSTLNGSFTINGVSITISDYTKLSVNDLLGMINSSGAGVTASYDSTSKKITLQSNTSGAQSITFGDYTDTSSIFKLLKLDTTSNTTYTKGSTAGNISTTSPLTGAGLTTYPYSGTFTINGVSIYVDATKDTIQTVLDKVNKSGAGVTMTYDTSSDKVLLKSNSVNPITVGAATDTSNILAAFNLTNNATTTKTIGQEGTRAAFVVNGTTYVRDTNVISDVISGVTFTLNSESNETTTIDISVDPSKGVKAFASFIQNYNKLMDKLNVPEKDDNEDDYTTYLADSDKESMSESDVADYQEKYELYNGYDVVRRSSELRYLKTNIRTSFFEERSGINSKINDMSDLGIKVAGAGDLTKEVYGYMVTISTDYDEIVAALEENSTFMNALQNNPKDVYTFFSNSSDLDVDDATSAKEAAAMQKTIKNETGWARYFDTYVLKTYTDSISGIIGNKLGTNGTLMSFMNNLDTKISNQEDRVQQQLERYWAQFTAMEKAIANAQSQSSALGSVTSSK
ncbi:flagellar filament capping protein FliD [Seleniivibrio woodruffii]|uniref:Flagellar hook-associated protein 2 n=1 Tax=Seleniivibrio woodruffii TaxID=1078050 RepID=A0A4R1K9K3_9BACT|nr:flagellar filament capping protein FliD [Seleniivibrio woodruffii]TCK60710.1 flagellar hook-associated protein 2 [Seleniivibrio woodruffii]TVZ36340.1 flagellar hook-associated protein 2 [Seleniivibrio woodruffii]